MIDPTSPPSFSYRLLSRTACVLAVFMAVTVTRLLFLAYFGSELPVADQWDSEGWWVFRQYEEGVFTPGMFFMPHNEHRIALSRLLALGIYLANNHQWDNLVEAAANALLCAATYSLVAAKLWQKLRLHEMLVLLPLLFAAACLPLDWENLLVGFQSPFYMQALFTLTGVWMASIRPLDWKSVIAVVALSVLSLFTLASGCFTALACSAALVLRPRQEISVPRTSLVLAMLAAVFMAGVLTTPHPPYHLALRATGLQEFLTSFGRTLSWPLPLGWPIAIALWLPTLIAVSRTFLRKPSSPLQSAALAIGVWVAAQAAAIAWSRGHDLVSVPSRYASTLAFGVLANAVLGLELCRRWPKHALHHWGPRVAPPLIMLLLAGALVAQAYRNMPTLHYVHSLHPRQVEVVRHYVQTGDKKHLREQPQEYIPYPVVDRLLQVLDDPHIRAALPYSVRQPLDLTGSTEGFRSDLLPSQVCKDAPSPNLSSFGTGASARFEGEVLHTSFPAIAMSVCGNLGAEGIKLRLTGSNGEWHDIGPNTPQTGWMQRFATSPARGVQIYATDDNADTWFAFARPVEVGRLTYALHWLLGHPGIAMIMVLLAALITLAVSAWRDRCQRLVPAAVPAS